MIAKRQALQMNYVITCSARISRKNKMLPPTTDCLLQHLKQSNYKAFMWSHALVPQPITKALAPVNLLSDSEESCEESTFEEELLNS